MRNRQNLALLSVACLALGACHLDGLGKGKAPSGQVVAKVDGEEVTVLELNAEMEGATLSDPKMRKKAEQAALQNVIGRKLLAQEARAEKLDKTPAFALQKLRLEETLLAQALQNKLVSGVPAPTPEEADHYISSHPDLFDQRKIFMVDQIRIPQPVDPELVKAFEPLKTMAEIEALLQSKHVTYQRMTDNIDSVGTDPRMIDAILKLPPNEVFVVPRDNGVFVNQIQDTKIVPLTGDAASKYALQLIKQERTRDVVGKSLSDILVKGARNVRYNPDYQPAKPAAPAPPASGG